MNVYETSFMSQTHTPTDTQAPAYNVIMASTKSNYTQSMARLSAEGLLFSVTAQGNTERARFHRA